MQTWDKVLSALKIGLFLFGVYLLMDLFMNKYLFFCLSPFFLLFLYQRKRDLKKERISYLFFFYIFFLILVNILLYYESPLRNIKFYINHGLWNSLLIFLFIYYFIEIFARYILYKTHKIEVFFFILLFSILYSYIRVNNFYVLLLLPFFFLILVIDYGLYLKKEYYIYLEEGNFIKNWIFYLIPYVFIVVLASIIVVHLPFHFHNRLIRFFDYKKSYQSIEKTPIGYKTPIIIEKKRIIIEKRYKAKDLPLWIKKIAGWKIPTSSIVTFLLMEFGLFVFLFLYKIFSGMRKWYLFLFMSIGFTLSSIIFFSVLLYKFSLYILKEKNIAPSFSEIKGFYGSKSYLEEFDKVITKTIIIDSNKGLIFSAFLNILFILIIIISIIIIFFFIAALIRKIEIKNKVSWSSKEIKLSTTQNKVGLDEKEFKKLLEKDPTYALEYLYYHIRKIRFPLLFHLTPYEFLEKMLKEQDSFIEFWEKITPLFIDVKYFHKNIEKETLMEIWETYKNLIT